MQEIAVQNPTDLLASPLALGDLLDATSLAEVLASFYAVFRLPVRILNDRGALLRRTHSQAALNEYLGELPSAAKRLNEEHQALRVRDLGEGGELLHRAFTGTSYHVGAIGHEGRSIGRFILGPFRTPDAGDLSPELLASDPGLDVARVRQLLEALPRVREDTVRAIARHLSVTLDALIYSGYRARLSEHMHLSSVQENGRQLSEAGRKLLAQEQSREESRRSHGRLLGAVSAGLAEPARIILEQGVRLAANDSREQIDAASSVRHEAKRLIELADCLRQLSDVESGFVLSKQEIELGVLLDRTRAALVRDHDAHIELRIESDLPRLWCDPARLDHALRLLCENALEVQADGAIHLEACRAGGDGQQAADLEGLVLLGRPPEALELRVADRGPNLTERERERARDTYALERGNAASSGLRLAIVRRLVEAHEGTLRIEDNAPRGAVFVITLPLIASSMEL
jgi:two-component system, NarL family, sensor histidine kinase BarA